MLGVWRPTKYGYGPSQSQSSITMSRDHVSSNQVLGLRHLASSGHEQDLFEAAASPCHKATHPLVSHCYTGGHTGFSKANISVRMMDDIIIMK